MDEKDEPSQQCQHEDVETTCSEDASILEPIHQNTANPHTAMPTSDRVSPTKEAPRIMINTNNRASPSRQATSETQNAIPMAHPQWRDRLTIEEHRASVKMGLQDMEADNVRRMRSVKDSKSGSDEDDQALMDASRFMVLVLSNISPR
ncbi:hypothetical protein GQ44DRAFT_827971 [Phaeosphaeriaceae sp. PMI808]|nr:hypothetical protein GQ44DRAFT_827971 [Phaeosphaeriaceae sp. PMI808]